MSQLDITLTDSPLAQSGSWFLRHHKMLMSLRHRYHTSNIEFTGIKRLSNINLWGFRQNCKVHKVVLMEARVRDLEEANEAMSKRQRAKKSRIQAGGPLSMHGND